jgi:hypothetical protein
MSENGGGADMIRSTPNRPLLTHIGRLTARTAGERNPHKKDLSELARSDLQLAEEKLITIPPR